MFFLEHSVVAFCMGIAKIWASLGVPSSPTKSCRKSPLPEGTWAPLWAFDYRTEKS